MTSINDKEQKIKLIQLVRDAISRDEVLREKYQVVDKFRFVRDRLHALLTFLENDLANTISEEKETGQSALAEDEVIVFVHLFNTKGTMLREWKNMVIPKVFYEYSINRPIYLEKSQIEAFIRAKPNKTQHAYLTVVIKRIHLIQPTNGASLKDNMGNTLVKVKEGSLQFKNLLLFTHNGNEYQVSEAGEFVKKI